MRSTPATNAHTGRRARPGTTSSGLAARRGRARVLGLPARMRAPPPQRPAHRQRAGGRGTVRRLPSAPRQGGAPTADPYRAGRGGDLVAVPRGEADGAGFTVPVVLTAAAWDRCGCDDPVRLRAVLGDLAHALQRSGPAKFFALRSIRSAPPTPPTETARTSPSAYRRNSHHGPRVPGPGHRRAHPQGRAHRRRPHRREPPARARRAAEVPSRADPGRVAGLRAVERRGGGEDRRDPGRGRPLFDVLTMARVALSRVSGAQAVATVHRVPAASPTTKTPPTTSRSSTSSSRSSRTTTATRASPSASSTRTSTTARSSTR